MNKFSKWKKKFEELIDLLDVKISANVDVYNKKPIGKVLWKRNAMSSFWPLFFLFELGWDGTLKE